jgi:hypothetical protein
VRDRNMIRSQSDSNLTRRGSSASSIGGGSNADGSDAGGGGSGSGSGGGGGGGGGGGSNAGGGDHRSRWPQGRPSAAGERGEAVAALSPRSAIQNFASDSAQIASVLESREKQRKLRSLRSNITGGASPSAALSAWRWMLIYFFVLFKT